MTLRIQRFDERDRPVLTLSGRIQASQVQELKALLRSENARQLILDLKEVKLVDRDAVRFLAQCEAEGTTLRNCAAYIREWLLQEKNGMQPRRRGEFDSTGK